MTTRSRLLSDVADDLVTVALAIEQIADALRAIGGCELDSNRTDISSWQLREVSKSLRKKSQTDTATTVQP